MNKVVIFSIIGLILVSIIGVIFYFLLNRTKSEEQILVIKENNIKNVIPQETPVIKQEAPPRIPVVYRPPEISNDVKNLIKNMLENPKDNDFIKIIKLNKTSAAGSVILDFDIPKMYLNIPTKNLNILYYLSLKDMSIGGELKFHLKNGQNTENQRVEKPSESNVQEILSKLTENNPKSLVFGFVSMSAGENINLNFNLKNILDDKIKSKEVESILLYFINNNAGKEINYNIIL